MLPRSISYFLAMFIFSSVAFAAEQTYTHKSTYQASEAPKGYVSQGGLIWMPTSSSTKTWQDANANCTSTTINGQNGWRLPTKDELKALYDSGMKDRWWVLDLTWSSTPSSAGSHYIVNLGYGRVFASADTNDSYYVTCVHIVPGSGQTKQNQQAAAPKGFVSQGGLTWMPISFYKPWAEANAYCNNTAINGQNGWRLPTKDELKSLVDSVAMKDHGGTLTDTWSSAPNGSGGHYGVFLGSGGVHSDNDTDNNYVACVR